MNKIKGSHKSKKFNQIIETARDLFMRYGIKRITVEEICATASVSKMTFYKYFDSKIDLALFILEQIYADAEKRYRDIFAQDIPYSEKAREIIKLKLESSKDFSQEMLGDLMQNSIDEVAEFINKKKQENFRLFLDDMIAAQKKGEIHKDINPHFILYILDRMQEMLVDERLLNMYESPQALISEVTNFFFYGILSNKERLR